MILLLLACQNGLRGAPSTDDSTTQTGVVACGEDDALFEAHVWDPVLGQHCLMCHNSEGLASGSAMVLDPNDMAANQRAAASVADRLLAKPSGTHADGHGGGVVLDIDSEAAQALQWWIDWSTGTCDAPESNECLDEPTERVLRRLTHAEYDRTVSGLLGLESTLGEGFAPDEVVEGFDNDAHALVVQGLLADQYRVAAETLAWQVDLDSLSPCSPFEIGQKACATLFTEELGTHAFRRPITQEELDRYIALWDVVARDDGFDEAMRWVIAALLQSPHFLYRPELGEAQADGTYVLTDWEVASELSYNLWGTLPDTTLFAAAEAGELSTPEQIAAQVDRMLSDPQALVTTQDLVDTWLQLDRLQTVSREGLTDADRDQWGSDTRSLVAEHAEGPLAALMQAGLLTERSVLTVHAQHDGSSPVHRGVMVRERMLCEELLPPPANLDTSPPESDPNASTRERYAQHTVDANCSGCHDKIDPIGFGFEHYDGLGAWRDQENGVDIDATGDVDGVAFDGVDGLTELLVADARFRACYTQTWRRSLTGLESCAEDPGTQNVTSPLLEHTQRVAFTTRVGTSEDTLARGERLVLDDLPDDDFPYGALSWSMTTDDWGAGWCGYVTVTNQSTETVPTWSIDIDPDGVINSHWSSVLDDSGDLWVFTPVSWNAELAPGGKTDFGFCADR